MASSRLSIVLLGFSWAAAAVYGQESASDAGRGDRMLAAYFADETARLAERCLADVESIEDWEANKAEYRRQLLEMLSLDPLPERSDLKAAITGRIERDDIIVEKLHFQSRPGLYVTGNLYLPRQREGRIPAILYVCGHGGVKKDGVSYGNKASYQHHGVWFARHGYACLMIDTLQLGEIEGIHHGTYRYGMWWWANRGYTPAGVEAWNCIRALDYLETREEIDPERFGVTGRSGGGAYSWWIPAIDDRIKAAVPVAGITDLENHVVDGCVEGHCDCMYFVNTYGWDYPLVAALVAPRPLMIGNSDADRIFPLDGVQRTYEKARRIYELHGAADKIRLNITSGPHKDTPELRVPAFRWFDKHLMGIEREIEDYSEKPFTPDELRVFQELPADQRNTNAQEWFVAAAPTPQPPTTAAEWAATRDAWRRSLDEKVFRAWPSEPEPLDVAEVFSTERDGIRLSAYDYTSQGPMRLRIYLAQPAYLDRPERLFIAVDGESTWSRFMSAARVGFEEQLRGEALPEPEPQAWAAEVESFRKARDAFAHVVPRGIGPSAWTRDEKENIHIRRRFLLLGQSLESAQIWDIRRAIQALRDIDRVKDAPMMLVGDCEGTDALALYASLYEPGLASVAVQLPSPSHREGPILLNVNRYLELPQVLALAAERSPVALSTSTIDDWAYALDTARALGWPARRLEIKEIPTPD